MIFLIVRLRSSVYLVSEYSLNCTSGVVLYFLRSVQAFSGFFTSVGS